MCKRISGQLGEMGYQLASTLSYCRAPLLFLKAVGKRFENIREIDAGMKACFRTGNVDLRAAALKAIEQAVSAANEHSLAVIVFINNALD